MDMAITIAFKVLGILSPGAAIPTDVNHCRRIKHSLGGGKILAGDSGLVPGYLSKCVKKKWADCFRL
jgi:hypothetical protein